VTGGNIHLRYASVSAVNGRTCSVRYVCAMYTRAQLKLLRNRIDIDTLMFCDDDMHDETCVSLIA